MPQRDTVLLERWRAQRDAEAFNEIVSRYADLIYATCKRILRNETQAEDVAQECFIKLAESRIAIRCSLGAWLHRLATHRSLNFIKCESRRRQREQQFAKRIAQSSDVVWDDIQSYVDQAIEELPEKQRRVIIAHFLERQTHETIACSLGVTRRAVSYRIQKGVEQIRRLLRRRGIPVATTGLGSVLASNMAEAAPVSFAAALGKLAIAGTGGSGLLEPVLLGGFVMSVKKTSIIAAIALLIGTGIYVGTRRLSDAPTGSSGAPSTEVKPFTSGNRFSAEPAIPEVELPSAAPQKPAGKRDIEPGRARVVARPIPEPPKDSTDVLETEPGTIEDPADYCSISGFVMDEEGNGLPGAEIIVLATGYASEQPLFDGTDRATLTNRNHLFRATAGPEGEYKVTGIRFSGVARVSAHAEGYVAGSGSRVTLLVPGVAEEGVDFILSEGVTLRGSVLTSDRAPVTDAVVEALGYATGGSSGGVRHFTNTDADGRFSLGFPGEGVCTLQVASDAHGQRIFAQVPISDKEVELIMEQEGTATLAGRITWSDGTPAQDLIVSVRGQWSVRMEGGMAGGPASEYRALVGAEGYYEITEIDSGSITYAATVLSPPTDPAALHTFLSPQTDLGTFEPGETRVWNYVVQECMTVKGHVYGEYTRRPLKDVRVCWLKGQPPVEGRDVGVGSDGSYEARLLAGPGTYFIYPRYLHSDPAVMAEQYGKTIALEAGDSIELDLTLPDTVTISIRAIGTEGDPVSGASITLQQREGGASSGYGTTEFTDEDGRFSWSGFKPGAEVWFTIIQRGYLFAESSHHIGRPGETFPEETVVLYRSCGVAGVAIDQNGTPIAEADVSIIAHYAGGEMARLSCGTDPLGVFSRVDGVPATLVTFEMTVDDGAREYHWVSDPVECIAGHIMDFDEISFLTEQQQAGTPGD